MNSMTFAEALQRAQTSFRMGEYSLARRLLERLLETEKDNPVVCNLLGSIFERQGDSDRAIIYFEKAIQGRADNIEAYNNLGVAYKNKGDTKKALAAFAKVIKLDARRADVYYNLGNLHKDLNQHQQAIGYYQKALDLDSTYILAYNNLGTVLEKTGQYDAALKVYHQGLQIDVKNARLHFNSGIIYRKKNRLNEAEVEFRQALKHQSGLIAAKNNLALLLQERREYEQALSLFHNILKSDPKNAEVHNNIGVILEERNIIDGAREHYEAALEINSGYKKARYNLALLDAAVGVTEKALQGFNRILKDDPDDPDTLLQAGTLLLEQGQYSEAEHHFRRILTRTPGNCAALRALGLIHLKRQEVTKALQFRTQIRKIDPRNSDFSLDLAFYYQEQREYRPAEEEIRHYLAGHPHHPAASVVLADILLAQKRGEEAERTLLEFLENGKREPEVLLMLAKVYRDKGMQEEALALLNEIITAQGESDQVREVKNLPETLKIYEEMITDYERDFRDRSEKNLRAFKKMHGAAEREQLTAGDAMMFEKSLSPEEDTVPIINIGGLEPVFEIREEEETLKLEEQDEEIDTGEDRVVEIEDEGAPTLMSLLDGQDLYEESPQRGRERRTGQPPHRKRSTPPAAYSDDGYKSEPQDEVPEQPAPQKQREPPKQSPSPSPPLPPGAFDGAAPADQAAGQLASKMKDTVDSLGQAMRDSLLSNALLAQQMKQNALPSTPAPPPPLVLYREPPLTSNGQKTPGKSVFPSPAVQTPGPESADAGEKWNGVPRYLDETEESGGGITPIPEQDGAGLVEEPPGEFEEDEQAPVFEDELIEATDSAPREVGQDTGEKTADEDELLIEIEPEDVETEADKPTDLREELKTFVNGVRENLDSRLETEPGEKLPVPPKKPRRLLDYLAKMENYLPQETGFQSIENEMRVRLETLRGRLSGKKGLFQYIESSFRPRTETSTPGLTSEKLVSTFAFMKDLSCFMPDQKMSMLIRRKIDAILGKMRQVSG